MTTLSVSSPSTVGRRDLGGGRLMATPVEDVDFSRVTQVEWLEGRTDVGVEVARVHFADGRWLEVIGASHGWPEL